MKRLTLLALLATFSTSAFALKVGYVNTQELFARYSQTKTIQQELSNKKKELEQKIQAKGLELQKLEIDLKGKGASVTDADKKAYEKKVEEFQKTVRDSQMKLNQEEAKRMQEIDRLINLSIQNVARSDKYDYVIEQGALKFGGENVTQKVLNVMERSKKIK